MTRYLRTVVAISRKFPLNEISKNSLPESRAGNSVYGVHEFWRCNSILQPRGTPAKPEKAPLRRKFFYHRIWLRFKTKDYFPWKKLHNIFAIKKQYFSALNVNFRSRALTARVHLTPTSPLFSKKISESQEIMEEGKIPQGISTRGKYT